MRLSVAGDSCFDFPSIKTLIEYRKDVAAPLAAILSDRSAEEQQHFWDAFADAFQLYETDEGRICLPSTTICVVGQA